jgi:hypothetical protein
VKRLRSIIGRAAWWVGAPGLAASVFLLFFSRTHALCLVASQYEGVGCFYGGFQLTWRTTRHPEELLYSGAGAFCSPYVVPAWDFRWVSQKPGLGTRELWIPGWVPIVLCAAWTVSPLVIRKLGPAGLCPKCRYDRAGLPTGARCPECGLTPRKAAA